MIRIEECTVPRAGVVPQQTWMIGGVQYTKVFLHEKRTVILRDKSPVDEMMLVVAGSVLVTEDDQSRVLPTPSLTKLPEGGLRMFEAREDGTVFYICRAVANAH